jgi:group I intron endonuclease
MIGIYKLVHTNTKKYYIGSSVNIQQRYNSHLSCLRNKKHQKLLQELYDQDPNFELVVLEECRKCDLDKKELKYLKQFVRKDPDCINIRGDAPAPLRGKNKTLEHKERLANSMLGKNGKHSRKSLSVTFISPEGKEYTTNSIKALAKKHNLLQSALNQVAVGVTSHHRGWKLKGTNWDVDRIYHTLPDDLKKDISIISPDGKRYLTKVVSKFEKENNVIVNRSRQVAKSAAGRSRQEKNTTFKGTGVDSFGRGWYIEGNIKAYTFKNSKTGEIIENVISHSTLAKTLKIHTRSFGRLVFNLENNIKGNKKQHDWTVEKYKAPFQNDMEELTP